MALAHRVRSKKRRLGLFLQGKGGRRGGGKSKPMRELRYMVQVRSLASGIGLHCSHMRLSDSDMVE